MTVLECLSYVTGIHYTMYYVRFIYTIIYTVRPLIPKLCVTASMPVAT